MVRNRQDVMDLIDRNDGKLYLTVTQDNEVRRKLTRRIGDHGNQYICFPAEEDYYIFHTDDKEGGIKYVKDELFCLDWLYITSTREHSRISSNIKKPKQEPLPEPVATIESEIIRTNASLDTQEEIWQEACQEYWWFDPQTIEEAVRCADVLQRRFKELIAEHGYSVTFFLKVRKPIYRNKVAWPKMKPLDQTLKIPIQVAV